MWRPEVPFSALLALLLLCPGLSLSQLLGQQSWPQLSATHSVAVPSFLLKFGISELRSSIVHSKSSYPPSFFPSPKNKDFICVLSKIYSLLVFPDFLPVKTVVPKTFFIFAISCVLFCFCNAFVSTLNSSFIVIIFPDLSTQNPCPFEILHFHCISPRAITG